jgi:hypothetical protein
MNYNNFWSTFLILLQLQNKFCTKRENKKIWWISIKTIKIRTLLQRDCPVRFLVAEIRNLIRIYKVLLRIYEVLLPEEIPIRADTCTRTIG